MGRLFGAGLLVLLSLGIAVADDQMEAEMLISDNQTIIEDTFLLIDMSDAEKDYGRHAYALAKTRWDVCLEVHGSYPCWELLAIPLELDRAENELYRWAADDAYGDNDFDIAAYKQATAISLYDSGDYAAAIGYAEEVADHAYDAQVHYMDAYDHAVESWMISETVEQMITDYIQIIDDAEAAEE